MKKETNTFFVLFYFTKVSKLTSFSMQTFVTKYLIFSVSIVQFGVRPGRKSKSHKVKDYDEKH